jgi:hypothetical protein
VTLAAKTFCNACVTFENHTPILILWQPKATFAAIWALPEVIEVANWKTEHDIEMESLNLKLKFFHSPPLSEVCQTPYSTHNTLLFLQASGTTATASISMRKSGFASPETYAIVMVGGLGRSPQNC